MRKRLSARFSSAVDWRVDERVDARLSQSVEDTVQRLQEPLAEWLHALNRRLDELQDEYLFARSEMDRIGPQVAALERRLEGLRIALADQQDRGDTEPAGDSYSDLLEEARLEHERARIRLEIASHYEERLRRLEEARE